MRRKEVLIESLIEKNIFKLPDGRDLYEGTEEELMKLLEETM
ncbi:Fur-regulated basic protein FbpA [Bacillus thuringiensis]